MIILFVLLWLITSILCVCVIADLRREVVSLRVHLRNQQDYLNHQAEGNAKVHIALRKRIKALEDARPAYIPHPMVPPSPYPPPGTMWPVLPNSFQKPRDNSTMKPPRKDYDLAHPYDRTIPTPDTNGPIDE